MSILYRPYTITMHLSGMDSVTTQTADDSAQAAKAVALIQQAMSRSGNAMLANYMKNMNVIIRAENIIMVICEPALTLADVEAAERELAHELRD
jgi:hypothetical protein